MNYLPFKSRRIFCAPPKYFDVVKGHNAFQPEGYVKFQADPEGNRKRLITAWQKVADELTRLGHILLIPELDPKAPDQVFAADVVIHFVNKQGRRCVLLSNMNSETRQREVDAAEKFFKERGYTIYSADKNKNNKHEGTGEGLLPGDMKEFILHGYGPRTSRDACQHVSDVTGLTVFALPLAGDLVQKTEYDGEAGGLPSEDVEGFHLDVLAQPLPTGQLICYWEGLTSFARKLLSFFYEGYDGVNAHKLYSNLIKVSEEDYKKFATNCFAVPDREAPNGYKMFIPEDVSKELKGALSGLGYSLFEVDIEVARWSGGGLHCMFNVEYDFLSSPLRKLDYVQQFMVDKWTNPDQSGWDSKKRRVVPGLRVFRPHQAAVSGELTCARP